MKLNYEGLKGRAAWTAAGVKLPEYDWRELREATEKNPVWVHFGGGNIFRGYIAHLQQTLLNQGLARQGICAVSGRSREAIDKIYLPHDCMTLLVSLLPNGTMEKEVVASVTEGLCAGSDSPEDMEKLRAIFRSPSLQLVSFTITEKGYALTGLSGEFLPSTEACIQNGPKECPHTMGLIAALLLERFQGGGSPLALVSMDNCSHNGEKLRSSVITIVDKWLEKGFVSPEFSAWVRDEDKVSFPWSMIDKIVPRPSKVVEDALTAAGIEDMTPIVTGKDTFIAPFVNAEQPQYLVIEDRFPNGRPPLEKAGVYMTDRDTVNRTEKMKVTTCLNPLHTALAVFGCLLGFETIASEMKDPELKALVERLGYTEGLPVVSDPKIIRPLDFLREVLEKRIPNPFLNDTPQRIATDTSQKVPVRFGAAIKSYLAREDLDAAGLTAIPLAIAGWLRYLLAVDDSGNPMTRSSDPMLETLQSQLQGITLGVPESADGKLQPLLSNAVLFGTDLNAAGLGGKIEGFFKEMLAGPGAVRNTLKKHL